MGESIPLSGLKTVAVAITEEYCTFFANVCVPCGVFLSYNEHKVTANQFEFRPHMLWHAHSSRTPWRALACRTLV